MTSPSDHHSISAALQSAATAAANVAPATTPSEAPSRPSGIPSWLNPFKQIQFKMARIDTAHDAWAQISDQHQRNPLFREILKLDGEASFNTWFNIATLHFWMLSKRLRMEGDVGRAFNQELFNVMWLEIEFRLAQAGVYRMEKTLGEIMSMHYGQTLAYDEGLAKGDAILASALYRNLFNGDATPPDATTMVKLLDWIYMELNRLQACTREDMINGKITFVPIVMA
ncbi:hypothetical protein CXG81DRAFT_27445 [Caulochytrium protostelioides]|uniref:Ubiquinol-cytochrome c chaperone domain-containing protein n=1 Tax=Caulochytrium protostelioides TaxID=1555241 RepID=A0A4P9X442_9FUNG|nr:hypothetical protein CXG81DRAFT_27445 [Caulochytrium protostelioides]|eukprot:RKO99819.1 hypothetical protein CXG81DRAFT_27445 [Caulochytrium protostelioides]